MLAVVYAAVICGTVNVARVIGDSVCDVDYHRLARVVDVGNEVGENIACINSFAVDIGSRVALQINFLF